MLPVVVVAVAVGVVVEVEEVSYGFVINLQHAQIESIRPIKHLFMDVDMHCTMSVRWKVLKRCVIRCVVRCVVRCVRSCDTQVFDKGYKRNI